MVVSLSISWRRDEKNREALEELFGVVARLTESNSFKRRLLRAAVQDNVNVMQDNWLHLEPRSPVRRPAWYSRGVVCLVVGALFPLVYAVATVPENRPPISASPVTSYEQESKIADMSAALDPSMLATLATGVREDGDTTNASLQTDLFIDPETLISVPQPMDLRAFALPVRTIVIDPGHGGEDPGAVTAHGLTEKELALDIGLRLRDLFVSHSFNVYMTREKDQTVPLGKRAMLANQTEGDLFISIHLNWVEPRRTRVVETYYLGPTKDSASLQLAGLENANSGYSLADFRYLLEQVYSDVKRGESRRFAEAVQDRLLQTLHPVNPALSNRAVKTAPFVVLIGANMPAILAEVACLSNTEDVQLLADPAYRQRIAQALFAGVRDYTTTRHHAHAMRKDASS